MGCIFVNVQKTQDGRKYNKTVDTKCMVKASWWTIKKHYLLVWDQNRARRTAAIKKVDELKTQLAIMPCGMKNLEMCL